VTLTSIIVAMFSQELFGSMRQLDLVDPLARSERHHPRVRFRAGSILTCVEIKESGILNWKTVQSHQEDTDDSYRQP
jgi:hypothetical protein